MNEFNEFCRAWKLEFPGQDLPTVWEEDTRANLLRHKKNLDYLKSEVRKEEFYVKFLEGILSNAENRKQQASPSEVSGDTEASSSAASRPPAEPLKSDFVTVISITNKLENSQEHAKQHVERPKAPPKPAKQYSRSVSSDSPSKTKPEDLIAWTKQQIQQLQTKQVQKYDESPSNSPPLVEAKNMHFENVAEQSSKRRISYENVKHPTSNYENILGGFSSR